MLSVYTSSSRRKLDAGIAALSALSYGPSLGSGFVKDDLAVIQTAKLSLSSAISEPWLGGFFRPASQLLFAAQHQVFGDSPLGYHLISVILHIVAALLLLRLVAIISKNRELGVLAAIIFAVHPISTESVAWISGQMSLLACLCSLGLFLALVTGITQHSRLMWVAATMLIGLGAYENFLATSAACLSACLYGDIRLRADCTRIRVFHSGKAFYALSALILAVYIAWRQSHLGLGSGYHTLATSLSGSFTNAAYYAYLFLGGTSIGARMLHYGADLPTINRLTWIMPPLVWVLGAVAISGVATQFRRGLGGDRKAFAAALAWAMVSLLPALVIFERPRRLSYLAAPGASISIAFCVMSLAQKCRWHRFLRPGLVAGIIMTLALTTFVRCRDWHRSSALESQACRLASESVQKGTCSAILFDVPNLVGDALFLNVGALSRLAGDDVRPHRWLESHQVDQMRQGEANCIVTYTNGSFVLDTEGQYIGALRYYRGRNWVE